MSHYHRHAPEAFEHGPAGPDGNGLDVAGPEPDEVEQLRDDLAVLSEAALTPAEPTARENKQGQEGR